MTGFAPFDLVSMLSSVLQYVERRSGQSDEASLAARHAVTLTKNCVGSIARGDAHDRGRQEALALAWAEAASKVRRVSQSLEREFAGFADFWSSLDEAAFSEQRVKEYVGALVDQIVEKRLELPRDPKDGRWEI